MFVLDAQVFAYSTTTFVRAMTSLLQIRQVAHHRSGDMQPARFKLHAEERTSSPVQRPNCRGHALTMAKVFVREGVVERRVAARQLREVSWRCSKPLLSSLPGVVVNVVIERERGVVVTVGY